MKTKNFLGLTAIIALGGGGAWGASGQSGKALNSQAQEKKPVVTSNMALMREKLVYANKALEGISLENYEKLAESAQMMRMISRAASWHVIDSDEYARYSKNFQEEAADLERHAKAKNLEAASLDYMRITMTCVQCHKHLREFRQGKKP
jgi:hypothetical protein